MGHMTDEYEEAMREEAKRRALQDEIDRLRPNAERYMWLRERWGRIATTLHMDGEVEIFENESLATPEAELLDEAIDAAMNGANTGNKPTTSA